MYTLYCIFLASRRWRLFLLMTRVSADLRLVAALTRLETGVGSLSHAFSPVSAGVSRLRLPPASTSAPWMGLALLSRCAKISDIELRVWAATSHPR